MPIADFEKAILRLLAANRNPESFVAGATLLLRGETSHRRSQEIDAKGKPVTPDPASAEFSALRRHFGSVRGAWPVIRE